MRIYADNAATTRMSRIAIDAMLPYMETIYGNPSSMHSAGQEAEEAMSAARGQIAECLGCQPDEIIFTSGGSEADNQAILSAAAMGEKEGKKHLISTAFEHPAVLKTLKKLERQGFEVELLDVGPLGTITPEQVAEAIRPDTALVTTMYANNEIGSILPIGKIGAVCRERGVLFHTDAVQAVGHVPINVTEQKIDMMSLSAHKFHGPKGIGVLYARRGLELVSLIEGGSQEGGHRAGTENLPSIMAMSAALKDGCDHLERSIPRIVSMRNKLIDGLQKIPGAILNGDPVNRLPGNVSFCFEGVNGQDLLLELDEAGICASSGAACHCADAAPSHVMTAIGRPRDLANSSLRLSLCETNTDAEVNIILEQVPLAVERLRSGMEPEE